MSASASLDAALPRYEAWLARETGIDAETLGASGLARAVLERTRATQGLGEPAAEISENALEAYYQQLIASPEERQALIETLVVPETWFFRDREAFAALARLAHERLVREPARALRVLSAPCSTGEEPYSIAMALLDAGIAAERFSVDAVDISERALNHARLAMYGRNSFRGHALEFRARHFSATEDGWRLHERVREAVRFARVNLFEAPPSNGGVKYDFIFCRNMLIYFGRDAQDQAIRRLDAQLADGGAIFVGPAETGLMMRHPLSPARIPLAFAFRRAQPEETAARGAFALPVLPMATTATADKGAADRQPLPVIARRSGTASAPATVFTPPRPIEQRVPAPPAQPRPVTRPAAPAPATLEDARRSADAGRLDEAAMLAHAFMKQHGPHADAFYLLGLIADAQNRGDEAHDHYRKALYLEPTHYEALTHLAALLDMMGDTAGAERLMRRVERATPPTAPASAGARNALARTS
ncbi:tetratricopeptide repeat protein [Trinickia terrae]|uniref:Tetratricopeptide repeat protein n=1 Tax=Trinickia terrae TaxID=2571161 RepID=A0A4U1HW13_9BURK|nr:CheR family methyltransferase [Trinickia terrae]TKC85885.1 tetratricopeptide repeat protein [Trinickia terrae]